MVITDSCAAELEALIVEHDDRGCYCPQCAEARSDLAMDSRIPPRSAGIIERIRK